MPTVGYASLQIVPSVRGIGNEIRDQIGAPIADAGDEAGSGFAKKMLKGMAVVGVAGAAGIGALLVKGISGAMAQEPITGRLQAQLGATGPDAAKYGRVAGQLFSGTMAENFEQGTEAIRSVMSSGLLPTGATEAQIKTISTKVLDLGNAFDADVGETATAVGQLIRNGMAKDATEGLDLVAAGLRGTDARGTDVLETFGEYSPVFKTLGLDGTTAMGLLRQGLEGGARSTDNVADALKEFSLRVTGGGAAIDQAFKDAGLSSKQLTDDVAAGGPRATAALGTVLDALRAMPPSVERAQAIQNLFGGPGEDLGAALFSLNVKGAAASLGQVAGAADAVGTSLRDNAATKIESFKRTLEQGLTTAVGGTLLPLLERGASAVTTRFGPAFTQAAAWVRNDALPAVADVARTIANDLVPALSNGATWLGEHLGPAAKAVGAFVRDDLLPAGSTAAGMLRDDFGPVVSNIADVLRNDAVPAATVVGRVLRDDVAPAVGTTAEAVGSILMPVLGTTAEVLTGTLVPALADTARWVNDNGTAIGATAGIVGTVLLPALITSAVGWAQTGTAAVVSGSQQVTAWVTTKVAAVQGAATSLIASYQTVGGWIAAGTSAVVSGAQQVGAWIATGARATWGMVLQLAASASVVGGWILMGTQSLIQAARMAAAWIMAMGPIGWITVAVIAIVALIIAYWDEIKTATLAAWDWVVDKVKWVGQFLIDLFMNWTLPGLLIKHWDSIKSGAQAAWDWVVDFVMAVPGRLWNIFLNWTLPGLLIKHWDSIKQGAIDGWNATIDWIKGVPGWIVDAVSSLNLRMIEVGMDTARGIWEGIQRMGGWLRDKVMSWARNVIPGPIADALGIQSPSTVMRDQVGRWIPAGIVAGIDLGTPELEAAMAGLVVPPTIPDWMLQEAVPVRIGTAAAYTAAPAAAGGGLVVPVTYNAPTPESPEKAAMEIGRRVAAAVSI